MLDEETILLALGIISGRINPDNLYSEQDWSRLGWNPYYFREEGRPTINEVKEKAERIILEALLVKQP